ncbi:MAG: hypothetical protein ACFFF9_15670 [Candidatus Thorarchaeota archaeon]
MHLRHTNLSIVAVLTILLLTGFMQTPVSAHLPEDMTLVYDFGSQMLSVNVSHYTPNTKTHYIEQIEILKNGISVQNRTYENQSLDYGVYETFSVPTVVDDNLTVTAFCSKDYSLTSWLIVTSTTATNPPSTETTTSTEPTDGTPPPADGSLGAGVAIAAGVGVVLFLIIFFAWLKPDSVPDSLKQLGSRIRPGAAWIGEKLSSLFQQIKTRIPSR